MPIENTAAKEPMDHVAGIFFEGPTDYIEGMEAAGQSQLVASTVLPRKTQNPDTDEDFEALGFTFGASVQGDELFREATLPEGWTKQATDHSMWSEVVDTRGIRRVSVFYKAAFYDRDAFMRIDNVGAAMASSYIYSDGEPIQPIDRLTEEEREQYREALRGYLTNADEHPDIYGDRVPKVQARLAELT